VSTPRVVVTGLGALTPIGNTADEFWSALLQGRSGVGPITRFDATDYPTRIAGEIKNFDPLAFVDKKEARRLDPFLQYAMACAVMAVQDAALDTEKVDGSRFGVLIGSGIGGITTLLDTHKTLLDKGPDRVSPFFIPMMISDMAAGQVSITFGLKGPNFCTVSACASGAHAIGEALRLLRAGDADVIVAGGAEATISPLGLGGFTAPRALSTRNDDPAGASQRHKHLQLVPAPLGQPHSECRHAGEQGRPCRSARTLVSSARVRCQDRGRVRSGEIRPRPEMRPPRWVSPAARTCWRCPAGCEAPAPACFDQL